MVIARDRAPGQVGRRIPPRHYIAEQRLIAHAIPGEPLHDLPTRNSEMTTLMQPTVVTGCARNNAATKAKNPNVEAQRWLAQ
jgi:hypothetical protein